jgi:sec-independent protein translocase protein TatA
MNIGPAEIIVVLVIALLVFGPKRLPQMGRQLGRGVREFRNAAATARSELGLDDVLDEVNNVKRDVASAAGVDEIRASVADVKSDLGVDELKKGIADVTSTLRLDVKGGQGRSADVTPKSPQTAPRSVDVPAAGDASVSTPAQEVVVGEGTAPEPFQPLQTPAAAPDEPAGA